MKNAVNTERVTFRLPSGLVAQIDNYIEKTEEFANRPDFVITAIRNHLNFLRKVSAIKDQEQRRIIRELSESPKAEGKEEMTREQIMEMDANVSHNINVWRKIYSGFKGEPTRVAIWIPIGFRKRWEEIEGGFPIEDYHDFIKLSIIALIKDDYYERRVVLHPLGRK